MQKGKSDKSSILLIPAVHVQIILSLDFYENHLVLTVVIIKNLVFSANISIFDSNHMLNFKSLGYLKAHFCNLSLFYFWSKTHNYFKILKNYFCYFIL